MKNFTARFEDDLHEELRKYAFQYHISMNQIIVEALEKYLKGGK